MNDDVNPIVKFMRLRNGDDVVAEILETVNDDQLSYTLYYPLKAVYIPTSSPGYVQIAFMPWVFPRMCDIQEFTIHSNEVMFMHDVSPRMNTYYWDSVDTYMKASEKLEEKTEKVEEESIEESALEEILNEIAKKRTYH
jgi:hypothetical protein